MYEWHNNEEKDASSHGNLRDRKKNRCPGRGLEPPTSSLNSTREDRVSRRAIATKPPGLSACIYHGREEHIYQNKLILWNVSKIRGNRDGSGKS